jgi:hypothetical protein
MEFGHDYNYSSKCIFTCQAQSPGVFQKNYGAKVPKKIKMHMIAVLVNHKLSWYN